jgi:uncharacterized glyoxalase superfamily protein PhnB
MQTGATIMLSSLDTVIVSTVNPESLAAWYRDVFELGDWESYPGHLGQKVGPVWFGFDEVTHAVVAGAVAPWFHVEDLQATFGRAVATGVEVVAAPSEKAFGYRLASVKDPDGNHVGLAQKRSTS